MRKNNILKEDLFEAVRFDEEKVLKSKDSSITDDDIDPILLYNRGRRMPCVL